MKIYFLDYEKISKNKNCLKEAISFLSLDEKKKLSLFRNEKRKICFILGRAFLRSLLAYNFDCNPNEIFFQKTENGRLILSKNNFLKTDAKISFNLSYSHKTIAIIFGKKEMSIDVEYLKERYFDLISEEYFADIEKEFLLNKIKKKKERFYILWTLKEAYIKVSNGELFGCLSQIVFHLNVKRKTIIFPKNPKIIFASFSVFHNYIFSVAFKPIEAQLKKETLEVYKVHSFDSIQKITPNLLFASENSPLKTLN